MPHWGVYNGCTLYKVKEDTDVVAVVLLLFHRCTESSISESNNANYFRNRTIRAQQRQSHSLATHDPVRIEHRDDLEDEPLPKPHHHRVISPQ